MFCWTLHLNGGRKEGRYAAVAVQHKVYAIGGLCDGDTAQMFVDVFNTVALRWGKLPLVTTGRELLKGHTAVLIEDIIYIWGGYKGTYYNPDMYYTVLYAFDVDTHRWFKPSVTGTVPEGRLDHSACVLGKVMFIYAPYTQLTGWTNDMYKLDTTTMLWSLINTTTPPPSRFMGSLCGHSATIIGTKMFVFGGIRVSTTYYNTTRVFDTETNCWLLVSPQRLSQRCMFHSAFAYNGELYIFCSHIRDQPFSDLWKFNPETFSWKEVQRKGKGPVPMYDTCCCVVGDRIFFGPYVGYLYVLDFNPSLKTLCKLAVIQYGVERSELPHNIRWELSAMSGNNN